MHPEYDAELVRLRVAYDAMVDVRDRTPDASWKAAERVAFADRLRTEGRRTLLEIGAGTGVHGKWFADAGFHVVCTDASAAMVESCRAKGLHAHAVDFLALDPAWTFDAVFAMNCLLHVPRDDLGAVLAAVRDVLAPGGLFYLGQYGGIDRAGTFADDRYEPKRFFSYLGDAALVAAVTEAYGLVDFRTLVVDVEPGVHFQAVVARRAS